VSFSSSDTTRSSVKYQSYTYEDTQGIERAIEVATSKYEQTSKSFAKVNPAAVSSKLAQGASSSPSGTVTSSIETQYDVGVSRDGPFLISETVITKISLAELAGRLPVPSYGAYDPSNGQIISSILTTEYSTTLTESGPFTRSVTSGQIALGLTQAGQQAFAEQVRQRQDLDWNTSEGAALIGDLVVSMATLVSQGSELRPESGAPPVPMKPSNDDISRNSINEAASGLRTITSQVSNTDDFSLSPTTTKTYIMPYAPDDFYDVEEP
jgi:hypothetical protein